MLCSLSSVLLNSIVRVLTYVMRGPKNTKRHEVGKRRSKAVFFFAYNMIIYIENLKESIKPTMWI